MSTALWLSFLGLYFLHLLHGKFFEAKIESRHLEFAAKSKILRKVLEVLACGKLSAVEAFFASFSYYLTKHANFL